MSKNHQSFRSQLLSNEPWDSPMRERYEQVVQGLMTRKLTPLQFGFLSLLALLLVGAAVLFLALAATQSQLPLLARVFLLETFLFTIAMIVYLGLLLKRGEFHRHRMPTFVASMMWLFAVLLSVHFVALIPSVDSPVVAIYFLGIAMIAMIGSGLQLLRVCIEQSELNMHQRLLEVLVRMSEESSRPDASDH